MPAKSAPYLAFAAAILFWASLAGFAALNPHYSHFRKSVSELGAWGEPNMWAFNVLGFIAPGLLVALFGWTLAQSAAPRRWLTASLFALAGILVALAGASPADMSNFGSLTTIGHLVGSNGSALAWFAALIALAIAAGKSWPALSVVSILGVILMLAAFSLYFWAPLPRAIIQRICFGVFFGWYVLAAVLVLLRGQAPVRRGAA